MMVVRYHNAALSSLFLLTIFLAPRRASLQLPHVILLNCILHLLSDLAAVFAVDAACSKEAVVDDAGSESISLVVTQTTESG
jgi:hypothetical protein